MTVHAMSILLCFSIDLTCEIVSEWLNLKDLSSLDIAYCNKEQRPVFLESLSCSVLQHLPDVKEDILLIEWMTRRELRVRELSIFGTLESCSIYLAKFGKSIRSIKLHKIHMSNQVDQHLLTTVHLHCSYLTSVVCIQCKISESVLDIIRHCTNLKHFAFVNCTYGFTDSYLVSFDTVPITAHVAIDAIGTFQLVLSELQRRLPRFCIQRLYVSDNTDYAFNGMQGILHILKSSGKSVRCLGFIRPNSIPDDIRMQTVSYCPNIIYLDISLCRNLTDASLDTLARHHTQLRSINVSCCNITNIGLSFLAQHRRDTLQALFASECHAVTGVGFNAILQHCHQLHTLGFNLVPQVVNTLDAQLLRNIRTLQTDLKCEHEIGRMLQYFTRLENLYIGNYFVHVLILPATNAPALRNVILGVANSYSHGNSIVFGYHSSLWSHQHNIAIAALQAQRPNLRVRYELGNDWPSNFMKLPV